MEKCKGCGAESMMPFYSTFTQKRKRYNIKDEVYCPVCKTYTETNNLSYMTKEEVAERQVGKPCLHNDGGTYKNSTGYYQINVCKKCGLEQ